MPDIRLPEVAESLPASADSLIGVQGGSLRRFPFTAASGAVSWQGKGIVFLGDSITATMNADSQWVKTLCRDLGATFVANHAASGRVMRDCVKTSGGVALDASNFTNADLVIVFAGTNDFNAARVGGIGSLIGTMADAASYAANSFYANTKYVVETLYGLKPTMRVVLFTPLYRAGTLPADTPTDEGKVLRDYANAVIEVGQSYACPVLDLFTLSGLNQFNEGTYLADGLHPDPTDGGKTIIGKPAAAWLRGISPP